MIDSEKAAKAKQSLSVYERFVEFMLDDTVSLVPTKFYYKAPSELEQRAITYYFDIRYVPACFHELVLSYQDRVDEWSTYRITFLKSDDASNSEKVEY